MSIPAYRKPHRLGTRREHEDFYDGRWVSVEEKVDGYQFSFRAGRRGLEVASSRRALDVSNPPPAFAHAVAWVRAHADDLTEGLVYRGEVFVDTRTVRYDRVPEAGFVLWEAGSGRGALMREATTLGLEYVPELAKLRPSSHGDLARFARGPSLWGPRREGVVLKARGFHAKVICPEFDLDEGRGYEP